LHTCMSNGVLSWTLETPNVPYLLDEEGQRRCMSEGSRVTRTSWAARE
jgi:hypothetical protein